MNEYESLIERLFASPPTFDFFQAVRILEQAGRAPIGPARGYQNRAFA